jgi:signal transduction histidine kinase
MSRPDRDVNRALIEAGLTLSSELSLDALLLRLVQLAAEITGARYGAIGVLGPGGREISQFITTGVSDDQRSAIGHPPVGRGLLGALIEDGRPLRLHDISADPRSVGFPPNHPPMHSFLGAPVKGRGGVFGNIYLTEKQDAQDFSEEDQDAVLVLAAQAGVAVENAHLYEELQRLAVLEDRERIAKELHDGVIQSLFAVGMGLQATATVSRNAELEQRLEGAVGELDRVIRDLRNYIFGLRPGILADRQLDQAIHSLVEDFESKTGVTTAVDLDAGLAAELSSRAGDVVQLVREALSNVGRHAGAATCRVSLYRRAGTAVLEIDDDGSGFEPTSVRMGNGLRNLEERARALSGDMTVVSTPGEGAMVRISIPV